MPRVASCLRPSTPIGYISLHAFLAAALGILSLGCSTDEAGPDDVSDVTSDAADSAASDIDDAGDVADTMAPPDDAEGCDGTALYESPTEPDLAGPWPVGARTVTVADFQVEVWYPAELGSEADVAPKIYDIRDQLPPSQRDVIPDEDAPLQACACYSDLPVDAARGPYPVVVFVHGTAAFRHQSLHQTVHWASRGFVVVAADHHGLKLGDILAPFTNNRDDRPERSRDLEADLDAIFAALTEPSGELAFLSGRVDTERMAVAGHSAGGNAAAKAAGRDGVQLVIPMASLSPVPGLDPAVESLHLAGTADAIVQTDVSTEAWDASPPPKRFVGLTDAAHLAFSDLCATSNAEGQSILEIANEYSLPGASVAGLLFDCDEAYLEDETAWAIINYATTAALEEVLHCRDGGQRFAALIDRFPDVSELREER